MKTRKQLRVGNGVACKGARSLFPFTINLSPMRRSLATILFLIICATTQVWGQARQLRWTASEKFEWKIEHVELTEDQVQAVIDGNFNERFADFMGESSQNAVSFGGDGKGRNPSPGVFRLEVKFALPKDMQYTANSGSSWNPVDSDAGLVLGTGQWDFTLWNYDGGTSWSRQVPTNRYLDNTLDENLKGARQLPHGDAYIPDPAGSPGYYFGQYAMSGKAAMDAQGGQTARPYQEVSPCNGGTLLRYTAGGALSKGGAENVLFYYPLYIQPGGLTGINCF